MNKFYIILLNINVISIIFYDQIYYLLLLIKFLIISNILIERNLNINELILFYIKD